MAVPEPDPPLVRNALLASLLIAGGMGALALRPVAVIPQAAASASAPASPAPSASVEAPPRPSREAPRRAPLVLDDEQRAAGHNECATPDPGAGYFAPPRPVGRGSLHLPARGGHTADGGYDVVVHFHGGAPVRKALVNRARGVAFLGLDLGNGSGPYASAFSGAAAFDELRRGVEVALRAHGNVEGAYVRRLALSGWSAGYGAINAILRNNGQGAVDAVVLLDGFHTGFLGDEGRRELDRKNIAPLVAFAKRASKGEKFFYFSHSQIATETYASTSEVAGYLVELLALRRRAAPPDDDPLRLASFIDQRGFHLRGFEGTDARAHCDHTRHIGEAIVMLEQLWQTPAASP